MKRSQELRQKAAKKTKVLGDIIEKVAAEARAYTDEESKQVADLKKEIADLETRAGDAEFIEKRAADQAADDEATPVATPGAASAAGAPADQGEEAEKRKLASGFRLTRALNLQLTNKPLDGVEGEVHAEAEKEARSFGMSVEGVALPSWAMGERRAATAGSASNAGDTIATNLTGFIESLRPMPQVAWLGAIMLDNLMGNIEIPRQTGNTVATWKTEVAEADETNAAFDKIALSPKRLTAFTEASRQVLMQSQVPVSLENLLRGDLRRAHELGLDLAAINGSGTAPVPRGVLNTSGIGSVEMGTNGGVIARSKIIALVRKILTQNADIGDMAFLSTPEVMAELMNTKVDAGSGRFLMENANSGLLGYRAAFSTQVPNNLTKGTLNAEASALIFGVWRELVVGTWGGMDVIVDQYTKATSGMVRIITHGFHDVAVRQPKAFAAIKDINTSATA